MDKKKRGRPMASRDVRVTPEFRQQPDIEKLGRALIAAAINIAEQKKAAAALLTPPAEGDSMT